MPGGSVFSFSGVDACVSSLKNCQSSISTGMDIAKNVAFDLVENHNDLEEVNEIEKVMLEYAAMSREVSHYVQAVEDTVNQLPEFDPPIRKHFFEPPISQPTSEMVKSYDLEEVNEIEKVMLEYAAMSREVSHYVQAVEDTVNQIKKDKPDMLPDLQDVVHEKFNTLESRNNDLELQRHDKYVLFKNQLKQMKTQFGVQTDAEENEVFEQVDEDIAVTQSQVNFICPITQEEMKKPVRNKNCGHTYEEDAILQIIQCRQQQKKKACCPKVGCNNFEVKKSDLVPDEVLKRAIDSQNKQNWSSSQ